MEKLIIPTFDLSVSGLMTEELFYLKNDKLLSYNEINIENVIKEPITVMDKDVPVETVNFKKMQTKGFYKKPLLFLSTGGQNPHNESAYNLLANILKALNLTFDDIALLEITGSQSLPLELLINEYRPKLVISFGAESTLDVWPQGSILNIPAKHDQVLYFKAVSLKELEDDKASRAALWNSLKILFKIQ